MESRATHVVGFDTRAKPAMKELAPSQAFEWRAFLCIMRVVFRPSPNPSMNAPREADLRSPRFLKSGIDGSRAPSAAGHVVPSSIKRNPAMKLSPVRIFVAAIALGLFSALAPAQNTDESGASFAGSVVSPSDVRKTLRNASLTREYYGREAEDWDVEATIDFRSGKLHAPTPRHHARAATITTRELLRLMLGPESPLLIDVLSQASHRTVAGAWWLRGAGFSTTSNDRLAAKLDELTLGNRARPMVFFCSGAECWASYNAALRASLIGYEKVYWYRGGLESWKDARLPTQWSVESGW